MLITSPLLPDGQEVEVHRTYIGFIVQGKRNPSIGNIHKIAVALKVDIKKLF